MSGTPSAFVSSVQFGVTPFGISYITNPFSISCSLTIPYTVNPSGTVAVFVPSE